MKRDYRPLEPYENVIEIQAAIEGLTIEQFIARDVLIKVGFSSEEALKFLQASPSQNEKTFARYQKALRNLGWDEDQVTARTQAFLQTIDDTFDQSLKNQNLLPRQLHK